MLRLARRAGIIRLVGTQVTRGQTNGQQEEPQQFHGRAKLEGTRALDQQKPLGIGPSQSRISDGCGNDNGG